MIPPNGETQSVGVCNCVLFIIDQLTVEYSKQQKLFREYFCVSKKAKSF